MNTIKCESCESLIQPNQISIYDKTIKPGIQARLWQCPNCNHKHSIVVMDKTSRRMMQDNKNDREKIGGINRKSQQLRQQGRFTSEQARDALKRMEDIEERVNKRTATLDERSKRLANEYKEAL